jgi:hypothetical protein
MCSNVQVRGLDETVSFRYKWLHRTTIPVRGQSAGPVVERLQYATVQLGQGQPGPLVPTADRVRG